VKTKTKLPTNAELGGLLIVIVRILALRLTKKTFPSLRFNVRNPLEILGEEYTSLIFLKVGLSITERYLGISNKYFYTPCA
jgi:hypothetical protein